MRLRSILVALTLIGGLLAFPATTGASVGGITTGYIVVLDGSMTSDGFAARVGDEAAVLAAIDAAGGEVTNDLTDQIGVLFVEAPLAGFAETLLATGAVTDVVEDYGWKAYPTLAELQASGQITVMQPGDAPGGPDESADALEGLQWSMQQIRTAEAHAIEAGSPQVDVGILDTGIDALHVDFLGLDGSSNVDCSRGHDSIQFGPGIGVADPCVDNMFHGTHVAGIVAARANEVGVVGVAPNVTLIPVKVCDTEGYCYVSSVVDGITYAGDQGFDVINMSFFTDDDDFEVSTEFKCMTDPQQRAFRRAVERAISYARSNGVTPVAALGNSDTDLADPPAGNECEVIPAEVAGVVGVTALGPDSGKSYYSNWGEGQADVAAPGGDGTTGDPVNTVLSTIPGNAWAGLQGTSMASPHAAGVAALIISRYGKLDKDGDLGMSPGQVEALLQATAVDIGIDGYDECFGHGRIDALRAVTNDRARLYDATAPFCPEYDE